MSKRSGKTVSYYWDCNGPSCARCARREAEDDLVWACKSFKRSHRIWTQVLPYSTTTLEWLSQQRSRAKKKFGGVGATSIHRSDLNEIHACSTHDLSTRVKPEGEWLSSLDALDRLVERSVVLPGIQQKRDTPIGRNVTLGLRGAQQTGRQKSTVSPAARATVVP